jgi:hypothetical protein
MALPEPQQDIPPTVKQRPWRRIALWIGVAVVVALLCGSGVAWWFLRQLQYEPTAHRHIPDGTNVVVRADAAKIVLFKPVREHIWPALWERRKDAPEPPPGQQPRLERLKEETGVALPRDLRELIIVSVDATSWAALIGGPFPKGRFVPGLHRVLKEDGLPGWSLSGELLVHVLGPAVAQADDGTLIIGSDADIVRAALPAEDHNVEIPLPIEGALSFLINKKAWGGAVSRLPLMLPGLDTLSKVEEARGTLTLSEQPQLGIDVVPSAGTGADQLSQDIGRVITSLRRMSLVVPSDLAGAKQALRDATVEPRGSVVHIAAPWPYQAIDDTLKRVGEAIRTGERPVPAQAERSWLPW